MDGPRSTMRCDDEKHLHLLILLLLGKKTREAIKVTEKSRPMTTRDCAVFFLPYCCVCTDHPRRPVEEMQLSKRCEPFNSVHKLNLYWRGTKASISPDCARKRPLSRACSSDLATTPWACVIEDPTSTSLSAFSLTAAAGILRKTCDLYLLVSSSYVAQFTCSSWYSTI